MVSLEVEKCFLRPESRESGVDSEVFWMFEEGSFANVEFVMGRSPLENLIEEVMIEERGDMSRRKGSRGAGIITSVRL